MTLRKVNAGMGLLATFMLLMHAIFLAVWMLSKGSVSIGSDVLSWIMTGVTGLHALVSIFIMASSHDGTESHKGKQYPKLNVPTIVQRISGVLLVLFTALHITGAAGITDTPPLVHAIVPPIFFTLVMAHIAVSVSKAFITLGIGNARFIRTADIVVKAICGITLIADITGFYLFVC